MEVSLAGGGDTVITKVVFPGRGSSIVHRMCRALPFLQMRDTQLQSLWLGGGVCVHTLPGRKDTQKSQDTVAHTLVPLPEAEVRITLSLSEAKLGFLVSYWSAWLIE